MPEGHVTAYVIIYGQQKLKVDNFQIWQYKSIVNKVWSFFTKEPYPNY